jgi:hypothetical protein
MLGVALAVLIAGVGFAWQRWSAAPLRRDTSDRFSIRMTPTEDPECCAQAV